MAALAPDDHVESFITQVTALGRDRAAEVGFDDRVIFALDLMAPLRLSGVRRHLLRSNVDVETLQTFLSLVIEMSAEAIHGASTPEELADAVMVALDELHSYLLAHRLVAKGYLEAERAAGRALADDDDFPTETPPRDESPLLAAASRQRDLALAA